MSVQVQKSPIYRREGINIHSNVFISVAQAILGGVTEVQGLYKPISLVVSISWSAMHVDVWLTSDSLMSCFRIFSHWHFCWYPDSCRLPSRPGYPAPGERHSKDEQLQLWRSLCSHQDQSAEVRPSPPCWSIRWNVQSVISVFLPFFLIVLLQEVD